jgi:hypothetical protein
VVLLDGAADRAAELVALERVLGGREEVAGVQIAVAQKLEQISVNLVGSGFAHHVDHAAHGIPVLRAHIGALHAEFLDRVGVGKGQISINVGVVVGDAIHLIIDAFGKRSARLGVLLARIGSALAVGAAVVRGGIGNPRREEYQLLYLPPIERQFGYLSLVDDWLTVAD